MERVYNSHILIRYGEIALKKKNRKFFETELYRDIKKHFVSNKITEYELLKTNGRLNLYYNKVDEEVICKVLKNVFGIVSFSPTLFSELNIDEISKTICDDLLKLNNEFTFKVETNRGNKNFEMKSPEVSAYIGGQILKNVKGSRVDVHSPDILVNIDIRDKAYIYTKVFYGQNGLPYGSSGRAIALLSGGIDSPVAAYMMAKRGLKLEYVHFHSYPYTSDRALQKIYDIARELTKFTGDIKIHSVNLLEIQQAIMKNCPKEELTIISRRFMTRIATKISEIQNLSAIVTGESLGQVASQTVEGLSVTTNSTYLPILRPLIGMDKNEIIRIAKQIETYDISVLPFEDCCTVFLPDRVVTKPRVCDIENSEKNLDIDNLIDNAIKNMKSEWIKENYTDFEF